MSSFAIDLERGIDVEKKFLRLVGKKFPCATLINGFKGYDIWVPEKDYGIEVKYDPTSNDTGNYFVEIEYNDKISGLMTSTAYFWAIYDDNDYLLIKPMKIIECIFMNKLQCAQFAGTGGSMHKKGFLIKKDLLRQHGKVIQ
jgi:hypothetical protein